MRVLAGDVGGTKTLLQITEIEHGAQRVCYEQAFKSGDYVRFRDLLNDFFKRVAVQQWLPLQAACFGVAGPVEGREAKITNLPWRIDADQLQQQFSIPSVELINDFEAVGYGIESLGPDELVALQPGEPREHGVRALIGAGTGLGMAMMVWSGDHYQVLPTEGGHVDFAPADSLQLELLGELRTQSPRVTYENILSGSGLVRIYEFLCGRSPEQANRDLQNRMFSEDAAAAIAQFALEKRDPLAEQAVEMFVSIYGAQAGNQALNCLPRGGVYVAGGIAPKLIEVITAGGFIQAFNNKSPMGALMPKFPIKVVMEPRVGLLGAANVAARCVRGV